MASKTTHVTTSTMPKASGKEGQGDRRVVTMPVRLARNVGGQARKGLGKPN